MNTKDPLNKEQELASEGFFAQLLTNDKEMIIDGPAGVGKTFLVGHLINEIMPRYFKVCQMMGVKPEYDEVIMTATTNKAADVMSEATGIPTKTIYSHMNLKVKDDYSSGKSEVTKTKNWKVHQRQIIFIDEGFMLDTNTRNLILEGTHKCKIVYVGDECQFAPVMEAVSPITKLSVPFYRLTEPMRNANQPALRALCTQLRQTVKDHIFLPIQIVPGVVDHYDDQQMEHALNTDFTLQDNTRILAYTNERVMEYNDYVRGIRKLPVMYTIGEELINNSAVQMTKRMLSVEEPVTIHELSSVVESISLTPSVSMDIVRASLKSRYGEVFEDVMLPVDREHFNALVRYFAKNKMWERYFFLKNGFPDLRPRDAATFHKSQGSTYEIVYIDAGNLGTCRNPDLAARALYVAASRAKSRVIFYGDLPEKYGTFIF